MEGFSGCDCLISFEWCVYLVQRCVSLGDDGNGVCGCRWLVGWVCTVRVEERMADRACLLVGCMFDYIVASSLFLK